MRIFKRHMPMINASRYGLVMPTRQSAVENNKNYAGQLFASRKQQSTTFGLAGKLKQWINGALRSEQAKTPSQYLSEVVIQ